MTLRCSSARAARSTRSIATVSCAFDSQPRCAPRVVPCSPRMELSTSWDAVAKLRRSVDTWGVLAGSRARGFQWWSAQGALLQRRHHVMPQSKNRVIHLLDQSQTQLLADWIKVLRASTE